MNNMDYSFLFNGTSSSQGNSLYSSLGDLYTIKSGTYKKLVSAYYKKANGESDGSDGSANSATPWKGTNATSQATELSKSAERIKNAGSAISSAVDAFNGKNNLFTQVDITTKGEDGKDVVSRGYDMEAIYNGAKKFVDSYNSFITEAGSSSSENVKRQGSNMITTTAVNSKLLSRAGITVGNDNKLSIDESAFKKADIGTIKTLFSGNNSFASNAATKAAMIGSTAASDAEVQKLYGSNAKTTNSVINGVSWDSFF